jgi:hypothetical protein
MKLRHYLLVASLLVGSRVFAAETLPLFNATLSVGKSHRFVLVSATGKASSFLNLGESFEGFTLKSYDPKSGVLEIEKAGAVHKLTLVADAAVTQGPALSVPATLSDAQTVLNKMRFEEMMERTVAQQKKAMSAQFERMGAQMAAQGVPKEEVSAFQQKLLNEVMSAMDPKQLKDDMAKIYSDVFTKKELDDMSAFFSTPLGEVMATKQPEVQEKLGAVIQGRMMEVMPRVQQMGREFTAQQKARKQSGAGGVSGAPAPGGTSSTPQP